MDDILVWASTLEELVKRIKQVLKRCRAIGMAISSKKLNIGNKLEFAGFIVTQEGIVPDEKKLAAIRDFPAPKDVSGVRSFLGMINQLGHYLPDLAQKTEPIRSLLKKETKFQWLAEQQEAFEALKGSLTEKMKLHYFNPDLEPLLLTDAASKHDIGYALIQNDKEGKTRLIQAGSLMFSHPGRV